MQRRQIHLFCAEGPMKGLAAVMTNLEQSETRELSEAKPLLDKV
jgi:hypothetical protein